MIRSGNAGKLNERQRSQILGLYEACAEYEGLTLSEPELSDPETLVFRYYEGRKEDELLAVLLAYKEEECMEVTAFTHPGHRCRGFFTGLFEHFLQAVGEDMPVCFFPDGNSYDALCTLDELEAEYTGTDHLMDCNLRDHPEVRSDNAFSLEVCEDLSQLAGIHSRAFELEEAASGDYLKTALDDGAVAWLFKKGTDPVGMCLGTADSDSVYLFAFCIDPEYQGKGFGSACLSLLLDCLAGAYQTARVQVTEENAPAFALYRKAGFISREELMEYWY